ncbi:MAG: hypothetical protein QF756_03620, partial [Dehalococcoidia bacterium]|nr:hypothetical protein [Dehalococcoidia bacterium]
MAVGEPPCGALFIDFQAAQAHIRDWLIDAQEIRRILESVSIGNTSAGDAFESLGRLPYEDVGDA